MIAAAAVTIFIGCVMVAMAFNGRQLGLGIRALVPGRAAESFDRIGITFLAAEIWLVGTLGMLAAIFPETEGALVRDGWLLGWAFALSWVLRDVMLWWRPLASKWWRPAMGALLGLTSAGMAAVLGSMIGAGLASPLGADAARWGALAAALLTPITSALWPRSGAYALAVGAGTALFLQRDALLAQAGRDSAIFLIVTALALALGIVIALQLAWHRLAAKDPRTISH